jgi:predicted esterase
MPEFQRLMQVSREKYEHANKQAKPERALLVPDTLSSPMPLLIALHGGGGTKDSNLEEWDVARRRGWLVLSPQSTHLIFPNAYWWAEDLEQRLDDIQFHLDEILQIYPIDRGRIVTAGISQGSGIAIHAALGEKIPACGFISIAVGWPHTDESAALAARAKDVRGYFVIGEKDHTLQSATEIRSILREHNIPFAEEVYPDLGHEFPPDLEKTFDQAIDFIFKEHE